MSKAFRPIGQNAFVAIFLLAIPKTWYCRRAKHFNRLVGALVWQAPIVKFLRGEVKGKFAIKVDMSANPFVSWTIDPDTEPPYP
jgi:hypothetical protein